MSVMINIDSAYFVSIRCHAIYPVLGLYQLVVNKYTGETGRQLEVHAAGVQRK